jgi:hypothetical protein
VTPAGGHFDRQGGAPRAVPSVIETMQRCRGRLSLLNQATVRSTGCCVVLRFELYVYVWYALPHSEASTTLTACSCCVGSPQLLCIWPWVHCHPARSAEPVALKVVPCADDTSEAAHWPAYYTSTIKRLYFTCVLAWSESGQATTGWRDRRAVSRHVGNCSGTAVWHISWLQ